MTEDETAAAEELGEHAVRTALLALLDEVGVVTATEAAARLGYSSGLCSFHLRRLAQHGHIEEAPRSGGRARPWRLRCRAAGPADGASEGAEGPEGSDGLGGRSGSEQFGVLARGLEDESWQRWLGRKGELPRNQQYDEAFSAVTYLTPDEMRRVADTIRQALAPYQDREQRPLARPEGAQPVALISRLFPLLPEDG